MRIIPSPAHPTASHDRVPPEVTIEFQIESAYRPKSRHGNGSGSSHQGNWITAIQFGALLLAVIVSTGCDQATYDRGFKAGEKSGYSKGYATGHSRGKTAGKTQGYAAGTATFVSGTLIPNLGLIIAITTLATATSWASVYYIVPQHRAKQAKYDAEHSIERTRKQLKAKHQITVRQEIKQLKARLKLKKHEQSLQGKLEKLFADASVLLLEDSNRLVDELCKRQLKTIKEIASANDLTTEERILLYPATANDLSKITQKEKADA